MITKRCLYCKQVMSEGRARRKYCSLSCAYKAKNETRTCQTCGTKFRFNPTSRSDGLYCNRKCRPLGICAFCGGWMFGRRTYRPGENRTVCSQECARALRAPVESYFRYRPIGFAACLQRTGKVACERCGHDVLAALVVHHRDRDRRNGAMDNLEVLCSNCHAVEHFADSKDIGRDVRLAHNLLKRMARAA